MYTELFRALLDHKNPRGHPILSALLYSFCPAAARWWLAGAEPTPPFDATWQSLQDLASGGTLLEHLNRYGFDKLTDEIKKYVQEVQAYRSLHPVPAPESLPLFRGGKIPAGSRFGSQNAIQNLGGDWRNLFTYVRTWAFLSRDWRIDMNISRETEYVLSDEGISLTLPGIRLPVQLETWVWRVPVGHTMEIKIGVLTGRGEQDQLLFSLLSRSSPSGDQPWPNTPMLFGLDRETGEAQSFDQTLPGKDLERTVASLAELAKNGPYPPLNALRHASICKECGYQSLCYEKHSIAPHALAMS